MQMNTTLLMKLFLEPAPQPEDKEVVLYFKELHNRMFPNSDDYIEFLNAQGIDRQYESAERIVHRLCYHANFPPSYYALMDIVCVENYQKKKTRDTDSYIPRDHFIHIVYLYLLGIYVFFYNSEFFSKIVFGNRFERNGLFVGNVKRDCIKDFISEWKYFCLYHDIGYSAEILGNIDKFPKNKRMNVQSKLKNDPGSYKASLGKDAILKQNAYFGSLEIISKLLFIKLVISNSTEKIFPEHKIYRNYSNRRLIQYNTVTDSIKDIGFDEIPRSYLTGVQLEKIYSNHCLKKLLPVIDSNDVVIIGLDKEFGYVGFITYIENETRLFVYSSEIGIRDELKHLFKTPEIVMFDDYFPQMYEFIYLLRDPDVEKRISLIVNTEYFGNVYARIEDQFENDFKGIANEAHFVDFPFTIYQSLFTKIRKRFDNTELETFLDSKKFGFLDNSEPDDVKALLKRNKLIDKQIFKTLNEYRAVLMHKCTKQLQKQIEKEAMITKAGTSPDEMLSDFVDQYFQIISDIAQNNSMKDIFLRGLREEMLSQIQGEIYLLQLFSQIYVQLKCTLDKSDSCFAYNYETGEVTVPHFLDEHIQNKVKEKMSIDRVEEVYKDYKLQHGNSVDHGFLSSQYAAGVFSCYRNALLKACNQQEKMLLSILLDIPNEIEKSSVRYIDNYNHVFTNVLFAVFVHNLYPVYFNRESKGINYRTKMSDPFTYLALLCDALQQWNRPRALHPALFECHPLDGASEEYNIDMKGNHIFISDKDIDYGRGIVSALDTYMANIKAYLKYKPNA